MLRARDANVKPLRALTRRQRQVLTLLAQGCTNAEIEYELCLSRSTVKTHLEHLTYLFRLQPRTTADRRLVVAAVWWCAAAAHEQAPEAVAQGKGDTGKKAA